MAPGLLRNPWTWAIAALVPLVLFPRIDIGVSALFFDATTRSFPFRVHPLGEFARKTLPIFLFAAAGLIGLAGAVSLLLRRPVAGIRPPMALLVVASLALGPGLVVNMILKDNWGRARPSTITEFNAGYQPDRRYTPALAMSDQCEDNCSFPSGHAALGFWTVSLALLAPPGRRRAAMAAAFAFGAAMGLVRIAQGGHFISDVAFSGVIVVGISMGLYRLIRPDHRSAAQKNSHSEAVDAP
ncbi:Putative Superfamily protein(Phosphatidic acid phosphatase/chloroperoxidase, N-terminal,42-233) [Magnetospirillum sp. XM-1]|uniref:phosphatase PAP2 family protein n=1 Tax=Magnetospirillum sp. XM-1 TaxID=1663591 RepID=UPI00073E00AC|nr:phosphatase PAP2 family protein [Magnetospirillum sp. XM-1]CUW38516.1 Putative Superfamily protein(Phosphatidic acid phosphatase/chloroperoxidase, N-terminal,42-233) [Magnetospirillum sp. XM-1]